MLPSRLAQASIDLYTALPAHGKPTCRDNGVPEWTILSTISLVCSTGQEQYTTLQDDTEKPPRIVPISLGTGVKVLPHARLPPVGDAVHDCHGEILARRGFIRWLIHQASLVADTGTPVDNAPREEIFVERNASGQFSLKNGVKVWLYVSALPCGDASTMYTAMHQSQEDASQWSDSLDMPPTPAPSLTSYAPPPLPAPAGPLRGRGKYSHISSLRTKPGRPDSPPSTSMSCSDKIASWVVLGLQGGLLGASGLWAKIELDGMVLGGVKLPSGADLEPEEWERRVKGEVERAVYERVANQVSQKYIPRLPDIQFTSLPFPHSKPYIASLHPTAPEPQPSALSLSHLPWLLLPGGKPSKREILSNGTILSAPWKAPGLEPLRRKGRSRLCKLETLLAYTSLLQRIQPAPPGGWDNATYWDLKHPSPTPAYQLAKSALRGELVKVQGEGAWKALGEMYSTSKSEGSTGPDPPFEGWLVSGKPFESFTMLGEVVQG
ncbi:hypothetical protein I350_04616 [Cryptococcus amylolentus CBS 6273]|uniref:A to I editase domain-containing protein n=1 Tax=Cryptococcus amylolentus CBS 6273 TaxID=1296118 RepID=A0A1E3JXK7_9TREE|nr:hypothetical protein I350_04616 [Cryptococcus amylolentus CBS 6273]